MSGNGGSNRSLGGSVCLLDKCSPTQCFPASCSSGVRRGSAPSRGLKKPFPAQPEPLAAQSTRGEQRQPRGRRQTPRVCLAAVTACSMFCIWRHTAAHSVSLGRALALLSRAHGSHIHTNTHGRRPSSAHSLLGIHKAKIATDAQRQVRTDRRLLSSDDGAQSHPPLLDSREGPAERLRGARRDLYE